MKPDSVSRLAMSASFLLTIVLSGCEPSYVDADCWLPVLRSDTEMRTLVHVGDSEDRSFNSCPVPVPRIFELNRSYGDVRFEWWGSPHRLYFVATTPEGERLEIRGEGFEEYENTAGSWLQVYSHRREFSGRWFLEKPEPEALTFEIRSADGELLDTVRATYDTVECTCRVPDYMPQ